MISKENSYKLDKVFKDNSEETNMLKSIEELQELSLILTQFLNKPEKVKNKKIEEEIAHVEIRMKFLKEFFRHDKIKKQINKKVKQLYKNVDNR